jgi:hypothetical protein
MYHHQPQVKLTIMISVFTFLFLQRNIAVLLPWVGKLLVLEQA